MVVVGWIVSGKATHRRKQPFEISKGSIMIAINRSNDREHSKRLHFGQRIGALSNTRRLDVDWHRGAKPAIVVMHLGECKRRSWPELAVHPVDNAIKDIHCLLAFTPLSQAGSVVALRDIADLGPKGSKAEYHASGMLDALKTVRQPASSAKGYEPSASFLDGYLGIEAGIASHDPNHCLKGGIQIENP